MAIIRSNLNNKTEKDKMSALPQIFAAVTLVVIAQLFVKKGIDSLAFKGFSERLVFTYFRLFLDPIFILGIVFYITATFFWLYALSKVDLTFAAPFLALTYVLILIGAWLFLGESISFLRVIGTLVVCFGLIIVSMS